MRKDSETKLVLWNMGGGKSLEITDLDSILEQGFDPYDSQEMANLFQCSATVVTTIKQSSDKESN